MNSYTQNALDEVKKLGAKKRVETFLAKIKEHDSQVGSFIEVYDNWALEQATKIDEKISKSIPLGIMGGLVVAVKNNVSIKGKRLTCGSKMLENYISPYNSTAIQRIIEEDGIVIGSVNLDEFCCGSDCLKSALKVTSNPLDLSRVAGGSSGGSSAAMTAGFCDLTLSEDTGGSIRCPASFCGVSGIHPTYGTVSRYGVSDMAMTFDQLGPIAADSLGNAILLDAISGFDEYDSTTFNSKKTNYVSSLNKLPDTLKIGIAKQFFVGCDNEVEKSIRKTITDLSKNNPKIVFEEFDFPLIENALPIYYLLVFSEFASAMQKFDGLRFGNKWNENDGTDLASIVSAVRSKSFGTEVKRRIILGTYITTKEHQDAWLTKALQARKLLVDEFDKIFNQYDLLVGPTMPMVAWKKGELSSDGLQMYLADVLTVPANCAGLPAGTVNVGNCPTNKMPIGFQVIGNRGSDELVLQFMSAIEKISPAYPFKPVF